MRVHPQPSRHKANRGSQKNAGNTHIKSQNEQQGESNIHDCFNKRPEAIVIVQKALGRQKIINAVAHTGDIKIEGYSMIQFYSNGGLTLLALNNSNDSTSYTNQFTYIVDDSNTEYQLGDVDGNGTIDEVDLRLIQNNIMGLNLSKKQANAADINQDGRITSSDYTILKNQLGL